MAFTASGAMYETLNAMRFTIAKSATFQQLTGILDRTEAMTRVIYPRQMDVKQTKAEFKHPRPRAIVALDDGIELSDGGVGCYQTIIPIFVRFEMVVPKTWNDTPIEGDIELEEHWFQSTWWAIAHEMTATIRETNGTYIACDTPFLVKERPDFYSPEKDAIDDGYYAVGLVWMGTGAI